VGALSAEPRITIAEASANERAQLWIAQDPEYHYAQAVQKALWRREEMKRQARLAEALAGLAESIRCRPRPDVN
jgi:hypothetical protein